MKQENRDLTLEVEQLKKELELFHRWAARLRFLGVEAPPDADDENRDLKAELENLRELQVAAEAIEGWFDEDMKPKVVALHKAIRKVKGMG